MNEFDQGARYAARRIDAAGALRWLLGEPIWTAWRWQGWLDTQAVPFPGEPDRRFDTAVWFDRPAGDAPPLAEAIEFMSQPRSEVLERLTEYTLRIRRELPLQRDPLVQFDVIGVLVNLTGDMASGTWGMSPPDAEGLGLSGRIGLRNLSKRSARDVLAGVVAGTEARAVLAWLPLLAGGDEPEVVAEWARLAGEEPDLRRRADLGGVAEVFAELAGRGTVWSPVLEGWSVERSVFLDGIRADQSVRVMRAALIRLLRRRLNQEPPAEVIEAVQQQKDLTTLERWHEEAATISSLDEARRVLGLVKG
jgi:hypothetical protein